MFFILTAYLSFADLDGGFKFISFSLGIIGFLLSKLNNFKSFLDSGKYLELLDISE